MGPNTADILSVLSEAAAVKTIKARKKVFTDNVTLLGLSDFIQWVLDPGHNFYMKKVPKEAHISHIVGTNSDYDKVFRLLKSLATTVRGSEAQRLVTEHFIHGTGSTKALIKIALDRKLPGGIGRSIVNAVWPGLIYKQPYGGCAAFDAERIHTRFDWQAGGVLIQEKADGLALFLMKRPAWNYEIRTRQGQDVTAALQWVVGEFMDCMPKESVMHVEGNLWDARLGPGMLMDRAESNGHFNAYFSGGPGARDFIPADFVFTLLDVVPIADFMAGKSQVSAEDRHNHISTIASQYHAVSDIYNDPHVVAVVQDRVDSVDEARQWAQSLIKRGKEGAVIKDPKAPWESKKMTSQMKIKNEFECTLRVVGAKMHSKHDNWVGSLLVESLPDPDTGEIIRTYVGSGLNEETGHDLDRRCAYHHHWHDRLVEVKAECITKKNALQLPRIVEFRRDKTQPDTYLEVFNAFYDSTGATV